MVYDHCTPEVLYDREDNIDTSIDGQVGALQRRVGGQYIKCTFVCQAVWHIQYEECFSNHSAVPLFAPTGMQDTGADWFLTSHVQCVISRRRFSHLDRSSGFHLQRHDQ